MKRLAALAAALLIVGSSAQAAPEGACDRRDDLLRAALQAAGEAPVAMGLRSDGRIVEIWARADGATWSLIVSMPDGMSCRLAAGVVWGAAPPRKAEPEGVEQ